MGCHCNEVCRNQDMDGLLCRASIDAALAPMRKLLLECMMLRPLSARGVQELLMYTLAAAEASVLCTQPASQTLSTVDKAQVPPLDKNSQAWLQGYSVSRSQPARGLMSQAWLQGMEALQSCGFAALLQLNAEQLVSNFRPGTPRYCRWRLGDVACRWLGCSWRDVRCATFGLWSGCTLHFLHHHGPLICLVVVLQHS
jgi:hypothetical protein